MKKSQQIHACVFNIFHGKFLEKKKQISKLAQRYNKNDVRKMMRENMKAIKCVYDFFSV